MPFGKYLKIKDHDIFVPNPTLEAYYCEKRILSESILIVIFNLYLSSI